MTSISYVKQQRITRLCVRCGLLLMQYGAESAWWWTCPNAWGLPWE
ncbi:putative membrane protein [Psychrobacter sp. JCM 18900]|nr:putative membrane protein [Psychrobacter sp. JCM 18900]